MHKSLREGCKMNDGMRNSRALQPTYTLEPQLPADQNLFLTTQIVIV